MEWDLSNDPEREFVVSIDTARVCASRAEVGRNFEIVVARCGRGSRPGRYFTTADTSMRKLQIPNAAGRPLQSEGSCGPRRAERGYMNAAFNLRPAAPASCPRVLTGLNRARARKAADRGKALGNQRMPRQPRLGDVSQHIARPPADEWIDLDPLALGFEQGQPLARSAVWKPFLPGPKSKHRRPRSPWRVRRTLRILQQRSGSLMKSNFSGSSRAMVSAFGSATSHVGQPEEGAESSSR